MQLNKCDVVHRGHCGDRSLSATICVDVGGVVCVVECFCFFSMGVTCLSSSTWLFGYSRFCSSES